MFKNKSVLEVKGAEKRIYELHCRQDSPLGELYDALCTMKHHVMTEMHKHEDAQNKECKEKLCRKEQNT